jgi:hypothetical protein
MGFRSRVTRTTLARANNTCDWRIWRDLAQVLIVHARKLYAGEALEFDFDNAAYAIDSSTITLCLTLFPWAAYNSQHMGIKLHTQLDLRGKIPSFILISQAKMPDVKFLDELPLEPGAIYVINRGYFDFKRLFRFTRCSAFFVTRIKTNVWTYRRSSFAPIPSATSPLSSSLDGAWSRSPLMLHAEFYHPDIAA